MSKTAHPQPSGYSTVCPADGKLHRQLPFDSAESIEKTVNQAARSFAYLRSMPWSDRASLLNAFAVGVEQRHEELARLITTEMGKPVTQARAEVTKCAAMARYHAVNGAAMLAVDTINTDGLRYDIHHEPLGPVLFISTWNNPLLQAVLAVVPQLTAGNPAVIKPAPNAPGCVLAVKEIFDGLGIDEPVYLPVFADIPAAEKLLADRRLKGVTFIGSTRAGRRVAELSARTFKPAVIDAGGSDPFVILKDADINSAVEGALAGRFGNTGQSCVAAKRIIVEEPVYDDFLEAFTARVSALVTGDPFDEKTEVGPVARHLFRDQLKEQLERSVEAGAKIVTGGGVPDSSGAYIEPTVIVNVDHTMPLGCEEVFGPLASVFRAADADQAIEQANQTIYGLGASLYTGEPEKYIHRIETGNIAVNGKIATNFPVAFGGIKDSGYGVYFGREGVTTFTNNKVVSYTQ